jgi:hypothetical protein
MRGMTMRQPSAAALSVCLLAAPGYGDMEAYRAGVPGRSRWQ